MNKKIKKLMVIVMLLSGVIPVLAIAAPKVVLDLKAEVEVTVEENGKMVTKRIKANEVQAGKEIFYTLIYKNEGDSAATAVEVKNPIPENTSYVLESAWGEGSDILFSIDNAKTFNKPSLLYYEAQGDDGKKTQKIESPDKYTDVMWVVKEIPAGKTGSVGYKVKVN